MEQLKTLPRLPPRAPDSHKGTYGRVLIVAGSPAMPGAAVLAARAALRMGSGLVTVAIPSAISTILGTVVPEATQIHVADARVMTPEVLHPFQAVALGPGLGVSASARELVQALFAILSGPHVVDADALNLLAAHPDLPVGRSSLRVWTPHPGELERLTGEKPGSEAERIAAARNFVQRRGGVIVLKGHRTVVLDLNHYYVNSTGNPGMATAGAGDVLTGAVTSLLGQGFAPFEAACLGVYLHGLAGDLAAGEIGEAALIAGDIVDFLPAAIFRHGGGK